MGLIPGLRAEILCGTWRGHKVKNNKSASDHHKPCFLTASQEADGVTDAGKMKEAKHRASPEPRANAPPSCFCCCPFLFYSTQETSTDRKIPPAPALRKGEKQPRVLVSILCLLCFICLHSAHHSPLLAALSACSLSLPSTGQGFHSCYLLYPCYLELCLHPGDAQEMSVELKNT